MNSTSKEAFSNIDDFFYKLLVPISESLHRENEPIFFQKKPILDKDTYFVQRGKVTMAPEDFESGGCGSPKELKNALIRLWTDEGHSELLIIAEAIATLAESAHQIEEQSSEVSPFIYVMF